MPIFKYYTAQGCLAQGIAVCTRRRPKAAVCMGDQASMTTVFEY